MDEPDLDAAHEIARTERSTYRPGPRARLLGGDQRALRPLDQPVEDLAVVSFVEDQPVREELKARGLHRAGNDRAAAAQGGSAAAGSPAADSSLPGRIGFAPSTRGAEGLGAARRVGGERLAGCAPGTGASSPRARREDLLVGTRCTGPRLAPLQHLRPVRGEPRHDEVGEERAGERHPVHRDRWRSVLVEQAVREQV